MLRFQRGDDGAFSELVRRFQDRLVSLAYRYLGSSADAEDVVQEVFLRVYRAREKYEPTARFSTWVYRITVNASLNHIRGRKARRKIGGAMPIAGDGESELVLGASEAPGPADAAERDELATVLQQIIAGLPERQRLAILLNKYEDQPYERVAEAMDLSVSAVKSLLTRARVNIKEKLVPYLTSGLAPATRAGAGPTDGTKS